MIKQLAEVLLAQGCFPHAQYLLTEFPRWWQFANPGVEQQIKQSGIAGLHGGFAVEQYPGGSALSTFALNTSFRDTFAWGVFNTDFIAVAQIFLRLWMEL